MPCIEQFSKLGWYAHSSLFLSQQHGPLWPLLLQTGGRMAAGRSLLKPNERQCGSAQHAAWQASGVAVWTCLRSLLGHE